MAAGLSGSLTLKKTVPLLRKHLAGGELGFGKGLAEVGGDAHHFAGGRHLRTENGIDAGKLGPGEDGRLDVVVRAGAEVLPCGELGGKQFAELAAGHEAGGDLGQRDAGGLRDVRHGARGAGIDFDHVDVVVALGVALDGELQIDQADDLEREGQFARVGAQSFERLRSRMSDGGQDAGGVAGVNAGLFNVLHDAGDDHVFRVAERVHVDLDGVLEEVVDEYRALLRIFNRLRHVLRDGFGVVRDDHGAAAENVAGADKHRITDALADGERFFHAGGGAAGRLREFQALQEVCRSACDLRRDRWIRARCR